MTALLLGLALLAAIVGLFWLKNSLRKPWLARLCYGEFVARLTVVAVALIIVGAVVVAGRLLGLAD
ncbi:MAG TPA: hypothetical protein VIX81_08350 [Gammaproteobacteria bacterium]